MRCLEIVGGCQFFRCSCQVPLCRTWGRKGFCLERTSEIHPQLPVPTNATQDKTCQVENCLPIWGPAQAHLKEGQQYKLRRTAIRLPASLPTESQCAPVRLHVFRCRARKASRLGNGRLGPLNRGKRGLRARNLQAHRCAMAFHSWPGQGPRLGSGPLRRSSRPLSS